MKTPLIISAGFLLSACAPTMYVKDGATSGDWNADYSQCQYEARSHVNLNYSSAIGAGMEMREMVKYCLAAKGWSPEQK